VEVGATAHARQAKEAGHATASTAFVSISSQGDASALKKLRPLIFKLLYAF